MSRDELATNARSFVRSFVCAFGTSACGRREDFWTKGSVPADAVRECMKDVRQNSNTAMAVNKTHWKSKKSSLLRAHHN